MKKIAILLIAVMVISISFANSCIAGQEKCGACDGTGKCNRCSGSGWAVDWDLECDRCGGSGDCQTCDGTGYINTGIGGTGIPGFELSVLVCALALFLLWKRKRKNE